MGLFSATVKCRTTQDGAPSYNVGDLIVVLYDNYLQWGTGVFQRETVNIYYSDIISVTYSNGGMFSNGFLSIGTAGRNFTARMTCAVSNMDSLANQIERRRAKSRR